jgi:hypothetical protein
MKNRNTIFSAILTVFICCVASSAFAQVNTGNNNTQNTETQQIDIYKEFSDNSFQNAVKKVTDSTVLYQHLIGIKGGYGIANVSFSQDIDHKSFTTPVNFGIYYTYLHSLWGYMPYFGFQTGLEYSEIGFNELTVGEKEEIIAEEKQIYQSVQLPLLSQFRVDFWKMRLFLNIGPYGYYVLSTNLEGGIPTTTNKAGIGIMGGGGIALVLNPVELQFDCSYKYGITNFSDPKMYSDEVWVYTNATQLTFNLGLFFRLGSGGHKAKDTK